MGRFEDDYAFGVMTSSYANWGIEQIADELSTIDGLVEVEISAVNEKGKRMQDAADHVSAHLPVYSFIDDPVNTAKAFAKVWNDKGIGVTIGNYDRHHSNHAMDDIETLDYTMKCIDFAAALGGKNGGRHGVDVGIFWGWNRKQSIVENIKEITEKVFVLAAYAEERGVRLTTENCHMPGGWSEDNEVDRL